MRADIDVGDDAHWLGIAGRNALITGGTRNIGRRIALGLARAGVNVAVVGGSDSDPLDEVLTELRGLPIQTAGMLQDLGDPDGVSNMFDALPAPFQDLDILVNCAAIRPRADLDTISAADWDAVMAVNLRAPFMLAQRTLPGMMARGFGRIINISGMDAYWGRQSRAHVSTTKLGIVGLARALASECARSAVTVNTVVPGTIETERAHPEWYPDLEERYRRRCDRIPMGRLGTVDEVAAAVLFLASRQSSYMTGQELFLSGGGYPFVHE